MDIYGSLDDKTKHIQRSANFAPRMCHSITAIDEETCLLAGGRISPDKVLRDCWLFRHGWQKVDDLPVALFRHSVAQISIRLEGQDHPGILLYGGKTTGNQLPDKWLLWCEARGWSYVETTDCKMAPRFGAAMASTGLSTGLIAGGMSNESLIMNDVWEWTLSIGNGKIAVSLENLQLQAKPLAPAGHAPAPPIPDSESLNLCSEAVIGRMGSSFVSSPLGLLLVGGVSSRTLPPEFEVVLLTKTSAGQNQDGAWQFSVVSIQGQAQLPLLIGHCTNNFRDEVVILGGGAVCFSFGTHWNYDLTILSGTNESQIYNVLTGSQLANKEENPTLAKAGKRPTDNKQSTRNTQESCFVNTGTVHDFDSLVEKGQPVQFCRCELGPCLTEWDLETLTAKVGGDQAVRSTIDRFKLGSLFL